MAIPQRPRPALPLAFRASSRELELDLDAFEGPFDLLLTLVLQEELELAEVDVAEIVLAFCSSGSRSAESSTSRRAASSSSSCRRCWS